MKKVGFKEKFSPFLALIFLLSCLFPVQFALALRDCGDYEIVSCETHAGRHFVAQHISTNRTKIETTPLSDSIIPGSSLPEEHDATHQIEKGKIAFSYVRTASYESIRIAFKSETYIATVLPLKSLRSSIWLNVPTLILSTYLNFLLSIRLQV